MRHRQATGFFTYSLLAIAICTLVGNVVHRTRSRRTVPGDCLYVAESDLYFGEIWEKAELKWPITIRNKSAADAQIDGFRSSCACTSIVPRAMTIPAGEARTVTFTIRLPDMDAIPPEETSREFSVGVVPFLCGKQCNASWKLHGTIRAAMSVNPPRVEFLDSLVEGHHFETKALTVRCRIAVRELRVDTDRSLVQVSVRPPAADAAGCFQVEVTPNPLLRAGLHRTTLAISAVGQTEDRIPARLVPVDILVSGEVSAQPEQLLFVSMRVHNEYSRRAALNSRTGKLFAVRRIQIDDSDDPGSISVEVRAAQTPALSHALQFRVRPGRPGIRTGRVRFVVDGERLATVVPVNVLMITSGGNP